MNCLQDYATLDGLHHDLADRTREAIARGDFRQVERLAAQMEAVGRAMDCLRKERCGNG